MTRPDEVTPTHTNPPETGCGAALTAKDALMALNALRSNVIGTQSASWSNMMYPFVAILDAAGLEYAEPSDDQKREHLDCYGGAGGYPGNTLREPHPGWLKPVGRLHLVTEAVRWFLDDPSDRNRDVLEARMADG